MQWLAQVMARRSKKPRFCEVRELELMIEAPQLLGRPVDVGRQCTEFVAIDDIDALGKVASGNLAEPGFDLGDRSNQRSRDGVPENDRQGYASERKNHNDQA